ncbi:MAG: hypothetical protein ACREHD_07190, partial [Pirellulales bacterium]
MQLSTTPAAQLTAAAPSTASAEPTGFFYHQPYTASPPRAPHYFLRPQAGPGLASREFQGRMAGVGESLRAARVATLFLVHGSFAAFDSQNVLTALARRYTKARGALRRLAVQLMTADVHDAGNYTPHYAEAFQTGLDGRGRGPTVRLVSWSSENHHLGRADAAVRLIDELAALELPAGERALFWGHSHAGNVFALMSQLLSADAGAVERFFKAAEVYYRWPMTPLVDVPVWRRVRQLLSHNRQRLAARPCDWVTFGTPIRYGWKLREGDGLLHFIHHRPDATRPAYLAPSPTRIEDALHGASGDYLQQVGIAGTDTPPSPLVWRSWLANRGLGHLFEHDSRGDLAQQLEIGARVPDCGTTLLVDYGDCHGTPAEHLAGHAVYT